MTRISQQEYYLSVVDSIALRSTCDRGKCGAIIVKQGRIIATGYAGAPRKMKHCDDAGHTFEHRITGTFTTPLTTPLGKPLEVLQRDITSHCIRTVHAEMNAILQAARFGPSIDGATLYCTMCPCYDCAKAIVNSGIVEVVSIFDYQASSNTKLLFMDAGIILNIVNPKVLPYSDPQDQ